MNRIKKWLRLYGGDSEKELGEQATEIEAKAERLEREAKLRERISEAEKRIKAVEPSGFQKRFLFILVVAVGLILLIAKACF